MYRIFRKERLILFTCGIVTTLIGLKVAKSEQTRNLVVQSIAKAMVTKDSIVEAYHNIREEADDLYTEAKVLITSKNTIEE